MSERAEGFLKMERQMGDLFNAVEAFNAEAQASKEVAAVLASTQASLAQAVECLERVTQGTSGLIGSVTEASELSREVLARELETLGKQQASLQGLLRDIPQGLNGVQDQISQLQAKHATVENQLLSQHSQFNNLSTDLATLVKQSRGQFITLLLIGLTALALSVGVVLTVTRHG